MADRIKKISHILIPGLAIVLFIALYVERYIRVEEWNGWLHFFKTFKLVDGISYQLLIPYYLVLSVKHIKTKIDRFLFWALLILFVTDLIYRFPQVLDKIPFDIDYVPVGFLIITFYIVGLNYFGYRFSKYKNSSFSEKDVSAYKKKLLNKLVNDQVYLNPELRIDALASEMGLHGKKLSEIISRGFNKTFFELINHYRIEHAKKLLEEVEQANLTVLEVMYSSGFNSKSAFYELFKKETGLTPKKYISTTSAVTAYN
ncbi:AraC family transcriptional regulator [Flagellimonas sp. S3867]|uniref:helix-turn-helix domain-containing protein n=1 Tax=Flagellimonas sp. S3867 TaxID=2768063 RepID=UPI00168A3D21|nr:helix-turn-helix domain-containing protein [Flagellimonas sp. S3867]